MTRFLYKIIILLLFSLWFSTKASGQWNHFITNFKKELYGRGQQTWQISSYDDDYFYFANKNGLLEYNGSDWKLFQLNNQTDVRSVHISKKQNRIYIGGESEFGYLEPDAKGQLIYKELSEEFTREHGISRGYCIMFRIVISLSKLRMNLH